MKLSDIDYEYQKFVIKNVDKIVKMYLSESIAEKNKLIEEISCVGSSDNKKINALIEEMKTELSKTVK